jgi:ferrous iron transport protein B
MSAVANTPESESAPRSASRVSNSYVALTGNPNCGKTTLFNSLTGLRAKVGNYAGVTVERKEGKLIGATAEQQITVLDLPGTYSLSPHSLDEQISRDVLFRRIAEVPAPSLVIVVIDASNLQRNLYYATQIIELGYPTIIALNMIDVAENNGHFVDADQLTAALGVSVIPIVASTGQGVPELRKLIISSVAENRRTIPRHFCELPEVFGREAADIAELLAKTFHERRTHAKAEALLILSDEKVLASNKAHYPPHIEEPVRTARKRLEAAAVDWRTVAIEARYARASAIQMAVTTERNVVTETFSDKLDRVLTHKFWGMLIFVGLMALMFQSIFTFAQIPMDAISGMVDWLGATVGNLIPEGALHSLVVDGVIAGVGAVVVFLPQICLLFLFISILEDTGYMARAAFLMDRLMSKVGLHGKSFIPMLSSFACAIPGIMATRTIESRKDRLVTILVAPLMSCSARLPVYTLLIAACIPRKRVLGIFTLSGLTMLSMYMMGIIVALLMAWLFKKTLLKGETPMLIMELPPYKRPLAKVVLRHMWDRSGLFLKRAGTVILGINILLWFLASYPKTDVKSLNRSNGTAAQASFETVQPLNDSTTHDSTIQQSSNPAFQSAQTLAAGEQLRHSFAGRMGRAIEPVIAPLGFDWKMGIGIVASFAAREVFVSTMSTVYNVSDSTDDENGIGNVAQTLRDQKHPDGSPVYTPLLAVSLMVFYVFALQCVSTVAVVRRETNSWRWPFFQWLYMGVLAWGLAFITYQGGKLLGF